MTDFEELYRAYFKDVFLYTRALSGDESVAEDVAADTFVAALDSADRFRGECDVRVWLCSIAKKKYFSYLRSRGRLTDAKALEAEVSHSDVEAEVALRSDAMRVHALLHSLDEPYKEVFSLRVFGELSFKQIGEVFQKTDNWACVTFHRARAKLKERLEEEK